MTKSNYLLKLLEKNKYKTIISEESGKKTGLALKVTGCSGLQKNISNDLEVLNKKKN